MDDPTTILFERLRAIHADVAETRDVQREQGTRLYRIESGLAALRRQQTGDAENAASLEMRFDRLREDVDRIKRRLDIVDP